MRCGKQRGKEAWPVSRESECHALPARPQERRLSFITNSTARYRGKEQAIVVEVFPEYAAVRLLGTRTRYEVS
jgi:hypothetical protein